MLLSRGVKRTSSKALRRVNLVFKNDKFSSLIHKLLHGVILKSAYLSDKNKSAHVFVRERLDFVI